MLTRTRAADRGTPARGTPLPRSPKWRARLLWIASLLVIGACTSPRDRAEPSIPASLAWTGVSKEQVQQALLEELRSLGLRLDERAGGHAPARLATASEHVYSPEGWHARQYFLHVEGDRGQASVEIRAALIVNPYDRMRPKVLEALRLDLEAHVARELARLTDGLDRRLGPSVRVVARTNWWQ